MKPVMIKLSTFSVYKEKSLIFMSKLFNVDSFLAFNFV